MSENRAKTVHIVFCAILFSLSVAACVLYSFCIVSYFDAVALEGTSEEFGVNLGIGLSKAFAIVFMLILGAAESVFTLINLPVSITLMRKEGGGSIFGKVALWVSVILLVASVVSFVLITVNNS